jgi:hypothetical protein
MFRPLLGHHQVNLQNIKMEALFIQRILIRAETCREYRSCLIKTLSIVAKQKVLLFTVSFIVCVASCGVICLNGVCYIV